MKLTANMLKVLSQLQIGKTTAYGYTMDTNGATYINGNSVKALIRRGLLEKCGDMPLQTVTFEGQEYGHRTAVYKISKAGQEALMDAGESIMIPIEPFPVDPWLVQKALDLQAQDRLEQWKREQ